MTRTRIGTDRDPPIVVVGGYVRLIEPDAQQLEDRPFIAVPEEVYMLLLSLPDRAAHPHRAVLPVVG